MRSAYLEALRTIEMNACKKIVIRKKNPPRPIDEEAFFDNPENAALLEKELSGNTLYQAAISNDPFSHPELLSEYESLQPKIGKYLENGSLNLLRYRRGLHLKQQQQYRAETKELLEKHPISKLIRSHFNEYVKIAEERICRFLSHEKLYVFYSPGRTKNKFPTALLALDSSNIESFFDLVKSRRDFPDFCIYAIGQKDFADFIACQLYDAYPCLEHTKDARFDDGLRPGKEIEKNADQLERSFFDRLLALFPLERIKELVHLNPLYAAILDKLEDAEKQRRLLHAAMLDSIPGQYKNFYPDARAMHRNFILHIGPTNSGKTYDAINALMESGNGVYLAPLRLLAYEQYEKINRAGIPCSLLTGEEQELVGYARIQSSTIEMADLNRSYDVAVIDEAQMIADPERGGAWTSCILGLCAREIHVCASPNAEKLLKRIIEDCGDSVSVIHHERQTPLMFETDPFRFPRDVRPGDALIVFSKRDVHAVSAELQKIGRKCSIIYGALPYDVRHKQAELFARGENEIVVATDAIGMGMNLPIQRVVFIDITKFDGVERRPLTSTEIKQIGGRAGRFGVYPKGYVASMESPWFIRRGLTEKDLPLTRATIEFPESLIELNAPLVDILERWDDIDAHAGWNKAATGRMLFLARRIQSYEEGNRFCYNFVTLPFNESDMTLLSIWDNMVRCEHKGIHFDVLGALPNIPEPGECRIQHLDELESSYHLCDLFYNYVRHFMPEDLSLFNALNQCKYRISSGIMHILSTQKLTGRRCRICNAPLPWNTRYRLCGDCYVRQYAPWLNYT